jgi:hypothetical protein
VGAGHPFVGRVNTGTVNVGRAKVGKVKVGKPQGAAATGPIAMAMAALRADTMMNDLGWTKVETVKSDKVHDGRRSWHLIHTSILPG